MGEPYRLPRQFLAGTKPYPGPEIAEAPLVALVNARAGGRAGPALAAALYRAIGHAQVFELGGGGGCEGGGASPAPVLAAVLKNLDAAAAAGDPAAAHLRARLVVLVAGGDGTVAWVLGTLADLAASTPGSPPPPPVAILPLGTGNDLALSFGWGTRFERAWIKDHASLYASLQRIAQGGVRDLDTWRITLSRGRGCGLSGEQAFPGLPHSLTLLAKPGGAGGGGGGKEEAGHATTAAAAPPAPSATGRFWNYFSLGPDAAAAFGFHSLRERRPWAAPGRAANRVLYALFSCFTGWYCAGGGPVGRGVTLRARRPTGPGAGAWVDVPIPRGVKGIAVLNLQSYAGGSDHWGLRDASPPPPGAVCGGGGLGPGAAVARSEDVWLPAEGVSGLPAGGGQPAVPPAAGATAAPPPPPLQPPPSSSPACWSQPIFNDGLVEVIGFKSGWHFGLTLAGLAPGVHAVRLAQAAEVELEVRGGRGRGAGGGCIGDGAQLHLQVDGEPWAQPLPEGGDAPPLLIRIAHEGTARMLFNGTRLAGVAPKIRRLAERERTVSLGVQRRLTGTASLAAEVGGGAGLLGGPGSNGVGAGSGPDQARRPSRLGQPPAA